MNKFQVLAQELYENENGARIAPDTVEFLAPYKHIIDGFFDWQCGSCGHKHSTRAVTTIAGLIIQCGPCRAVNLLVRTNSDQIDEMIKQKRGYDDRLRALEYREADLDKAVKSKLGPIVTNIIYHLRTAINFLESQIK